MKRVVAIIFILFNHIIYGQQATHVVIAEIYGGGGNSGAPYTNDYIVLYNPTASSVTLSSCSIQYAADTSDTYSVVNLSGNISAMSYYMIQMGSGGSSGSTLPVTPNVTSTKNISATKGKVALVSNQQTISGISDTDVIDFVGYGTTASQYEGSGRAPAPSNTSSDRRKDNNGNLTYGDNGSGWDTNNNNADFYTESNLTLHQPLPVELISFTSSVSKNKVLLNWQTATEVNNYGFEIERSAISRQQSAWEKIGFIQGNGNSNSPKNFSFTDEPTGGKEFKYHLKQIDFNGSYEYSNEVTAVLENITAFKLDQNYPNPFNPTTKISYTIPQRVNVKLRVYDMLAQRVEELVNGTQEEGRYEVTFDGNNLPSGAYFYKLEAGSYIEVKKLLLIK